MSKDKKPYTLSPELDLDFPDAPDFISKPPVYTVAEMIKLCEAMLPYWNAERIKNMKKVEMEEFKID